MKTEEDVLRSGVDEVESAVDRYRRWEPQLKAFAWFDEAHARREAQKRRRGVSSRPLPLRGLPVGVKDVFDTAGIPTEYGSSIFSGRVPDRSATAVRRLEAAGAFLFGKTVTAELAYFDPGPTTNPWNPERTPGGSSMGSAAAVAAGIVPASIGTQTNGSVIRPAAFCGVVGFKPTAGRLPRAGVLRFSPSLDQLGVFARRVKTTARLAAVIAGDPVAEWLGQPEWNTRPRLGVVRGLDWSIAEPGARRQFESSMSALVAAGATPVDVDLPTELAEALPVLRTIMAVEANRWIGALVAGNRTQCSAQLLTLLDEGAQAGASDYRAARAARRRLIRGFGELLTGLDAIVTLPALGEAPPLATTGDPRCCTRWTLVGAPALTLPSGIGPAGLPLGIQLVGHIGHDAELIATAAWVEAVLPGIGEPPQPRPVSVGSGR